MLSQKQIHCNAVHLTLLCCSVVVFISCVCVLIRFIYSVFCSRKEQNSKRFDVVVTLFSTLTFVFWTISAATVLVFRLCQCVLNKWIVLLAYGVSGMYGVGLSTLMIVFILRLYNTLSQTEYRLNKPTMIFLCIVYIVMVACGIATLFSFLGEHFLLSLIFISLNGSMYILLSISLLILFIRCLVKIQIRVAYSMLANESMSSVLTVTSSCNGNYNNDNINISNYKLSNKSNYSARKIRIINVISKCLILVSISLFSSILMACVLMIFEYEFADFAVIMDIFVNVICLYLQFSFSKNEYNCLCGHCHKAIQSRFIGHIDDRATTKLNVIVELEKQSIHSDTACDNVSYSRM